MSAFSPSHGHSQIDSQNTFQFGRLSPHELSPLQDSKIKAVSHMEHTLKVVIVVTYSISPRVSFNDWARTSLRYSCFVRFQKFPTPLAFFCRTSALICFVDLFSSVGYLGPLQPC